MSITVRKREDKRNERKGDGGQRRNDADVLLFWPAGRELNVERKPFHCLMSIRGKVVLYLKDTLEKVS